MSNEGAAPPAGWYPDPQNPYLQRWWNGSAWTEAAAVHNVPTANGLVAVAASGPTPSRNRLAVWGFGLALAVWGFGLALAAVVIGGVQALGGFVFLVTTELAGLG